MTPRTLAFAAVAAASLAAGAAYLVPAMLRGPDGAPSAFVGAPGVGAPGQQIQGSIQPASMSPEELDRAQSSAIAEFAVEIGTMYGAAAVCEPQVAGGILACANLIITKWPQLTNLPPPSDPRLSATVSENWTKASEAARQLQAGRTPPATCEQVVQRVRRSPIWGICDRIHALSPADGAPPALIDGQGSQPQRPQDGQQRPTVQPPASQRPQGGQAQQPTPRAPQVPLRVQ